MKPFSSHLRSRTAFTLIELLVVMSIMLVMLALLVPAITGIKGANDLTKASYDIAGTLEQARAYAMANRTYVWVGFAEVDVSVSDSTVPQKAATTTAGGRVAVAVVASKDGTRGYDVTNASLATPPWSLNGSTITTGSTLMALNKLQYFDNVHMVAAGVLNGFSATKNSDGTVGAGGMRRPGITSNTYVLTSGSNTVTQFAWPLGNSLNSSSAKYNFGTVINFDPQGVARLQTKTNTDTIGQYMEVGLQPTHGNIVPSGTTGNLTAIQVDGMTGTTRVYRP